MLNSQASNGRRNGLVVCTLVPLSLLTHVANMSQLVERAVEKSEDVKVVGTEVASVSGNDALPVYELGPGKPDGVEVFTTEIDNGEETLDNEHVIVTGADAAAHLLSIRDDGDPSVTFRGLFLATCLAGFMAVLQQIYNVSAGRNSHTTPNLTS